MANIFKRKIQVDVSTGGSTVYTVPASTTAVVIGFMITNKTANNIKVEADAGGVQVIGTDTIIPAGSSLSGLDGKIVLETTDTLVVTCDTATACDVLLSIMEQT